MARPASKWNQPGKLVCTASQKQTVKRAKQALKG